MYATKMCRVAFLAALVAGALSAGCSPGPGSDGGLARGGFTQSKGAAQTASTVDSITVVFQMTGLLMLVPGQGNDSAQVLIPNVSNHAARLGFGGDSSAICSEYLERICYVDLDSFRVHPIGAGGGIPAQMFSLASHSANVTRGSGGQYRVQVPKIDPKLRGRVVFKAGGLSGDTCSLASWTFTPVDSTGAKGATDTVELPNVVRWAIRYPANQTFSIRLQRRGQGQAPVDVPLRAVANDSILVVLAHVPTDELKDLPPTAPKEPTESPPAELTHYHDFYNLLSKPGGEDPPPGTFRPLPIYRADAATMCPVRISTTAVDSAGGIPQERTESGGVKTYGCVVGSGEG